MASSSRNKKRKASADPHDELRDMDRALYATFRSAANALGSLYTSSVHAQKRAFNAGARHTTRKLMEWAVAMRDGGEGSVDLNEFAAALRAELVVLEGEDDAMRDHEDLGGASTANPGAVAGVVARDGGATAGVATRGSKHHLATLEFNNLAQQVREDGAPPRSSFFLLRTNERTNESQHIDLALSLTRLPPSLPPSLPSFLPSFLSAQAATNAKHAAMLGQAFTTHQPRLRSPASAAPRKPSAVGEDDASDGGGGGMED
jgi:hypothetical protein